MDLGKTLITTLVTAAVLAGFSAAQAATVPFTEDFALTNEGWTDAAGTSLTYVGAGGPDASSFVTGTASFVAANENDFVSVIRGQDNTDASGDAFVGDWIAAGVTEFTTWVRHNAPFPLPMFARFATPTNFPGAAGIQFAPVPSDTWTQLTIAINPASPQIVLEGPGSSFNAVFGNLGNIQIGVQVPAGLAGFTPPVTFDLDQPTITPEPASLGLLAVGGLALLRRR
jgi:hypothetical protein